jgi:DNA-binding transcriptional regulator GbsR (MarR family)
LNNPGGGASFLPVSRNLANGEQQAAAPLGVIERQVVDFFVDGVKVLGLPGSIGEIYGMLFLAAEPLALDDLVAGLGISKGSVSQGLRTLKELGAVREVALPAERRTHFEAAVELKRLVGGFIREQIRPHLHSGIGKIGKLRETAALEPDPDRREFVGDRLHRLEHWLKTGHRVLPVVQKLLGE